MSATNGTPTEDRLQEALNDVEELRGELESAKADYNEATRRAEDARQKLEGIGREAETVSEQMKDILGAVRRESVIWAGITSLIIWGVLWGLGAL
jgi:septation ring formation regulator EzrA